MSRDWREPIWRQGEGLDAASWERAESKQTLVDTTDPKGSYWESIL